MSFFQHLSISKTKNIRKWTLLSIFFLLALSVWVQASQVRIIPGETLQQSSKTAVIILSYLLFLKISMWIYWNPRFNWWKNCQHHPWRLQWWWGRRLWIKERRNSQGPINFWSYKSNNKAWLWNIWNYWWCSVTFSWRMSS